jgi:hypothetical protein
MGKTSSMNGETRNTQFYSKILNERDHLRDLGVCGRMNLVGRFRRRLEGNIKKDVNDIRCEGVECTLKPQDRNQWRTLLNSVMTFRVP